MDISHGASTRASPSLVRAPLNPAWHEHAADSRGALQLQTSEDGRLLGLIPPPLSLPSKMVPHGSHLRKLPLPESFDLRLLDGVTRIRDQGNCGSCWAFASFASLESYLKYQKKQARNYSEADLNQYHGYSIRECEGGNHFMATAYFARWAGPVRESEVPYPYDKLGTTPGVPVRKHVQNVWFLPDRSSFLENDLVKEMVLTYGAVYVSFLYKNTYYNDATAAYYNNKPAGEDEGNHAVAIVGWDDHFPSSNFNSSIRPPGDGAFIVKNSWGSSWGEEGYFYLSYYDASLHTGVLYNGAEPITNYTRIYEYDPLGWTVSAGFSSDNSSQAWFANIFIASSDASKIKGVSFYTPVPDSSYTLFVYSNTSINAPRSGQLVKKLKGMVQYAGYHTVRFRCSANVKPGKRFSVVVKLSTPNWDYPIPVEDYVTSYSEGVNAYSGQSYVSPDGSSWSDLTTESGFSRANVCVKAFGTR